MENQIVKTQMDSGKSRRKLLAQFGVAAAAVGLAPLASAGVSAQDGTPTAGGGSAAIGSPVSFISVEGVEVARITINKVTDPFTGYNPAYPPQRGSRFLLLSVTAENVGPNPWTFDPGRIFLQDVEGFVTYPSNVDLGPEPAEPAIAYQDVPPATTVSGATGYVLIKGVTPVRVFFAPANDRLILLAELA